MLHAGMKRRRAAGPVEEPNERVFWDRFDELSEWSAALSPPSRLPRVAPDAGEMFHCWDHLVSPVRRRPELLPEALRLAVLELDDALEKLWRDHRRDTFERLKTRHGWARVQRCAVALGQALASRRDE